MAPPTLCIPERFPLAEPLELPLKCPPPLGSRKVCSPCSRKRCLKGKPSSSQPPPCRRHLPKPPRRMIRHPSLSMPLRHLELRPRSTSPRSSPPLQSPPPLSPPLRAAASTVRAEPKKLANGLTRALGGNGGEGYVSAASARHGRRKRHLREAR